MDGIRRSRRNADRAAKARRDLEEDKKQQLREISDIYEYVSDDEYQNIVAQRTKNGQFVVDDTGNGTASGYYDNGEDDFGENPEEDDEYNLYHNGELSKKYLKKGEKMVNENKGTVQGRLDRAFFKKGKEFSVIQPTETKKKAAVLDGDDFENLLNFDLPQPKKSQKRSSNPISSPMKKKEITSDIYMKEEPVDNSYSVKQEDWNEPQQTSFSEDSMIEPPKRNLMNEYEKNDSIIPPAGNSLNEEEALQLLEESMIVEEEKKPVETNEVINDDDLMKLIDEETVEKPIFNSHSTENEENIEKMLELLKDEEIDEIMNQSTNMQSAKPTVQTTSLVQVNEGVSSIEFYLTEVFEDYNMAPGQLFLFGRIPVGQHTESVCIVVKNVPHHLYFLPAMKENEERYSVTEVKEEIFSVLSKIVSSPREVAFRIDRKKYAFEIADIPTEETDYIHVVYPGRYPAFPHLSGRTYQHVFGRTTSASETFSLECNVKGTQWLKLSNITVNEIHKSYCQHEFSLESIQNNVMVIPDRAPPTLRVLSIQLTAVSRANTNQIQVNAAAVSVYDSIAADRATEPRFQNPIQSCSWICPLGSFPPRFIQEMEKNHLKTRNVPNELELLRCLFDYISQMDPDIIVGHNITGNDLPILQSRIMRYKLNWSKLGRLRRSSTLPRLLVNDLPYVLFCGRLCVDTYSSAKELIKEEDYSLTYLCHKYTRVQAREFENAQIPLLFQSATRLCGLLKSLLINVNAVLQLMLNLQIVPLTHQISTISGLWWNRCLRSNRSERVEYYLLHGFHQLNFIVPDKQTKEKIGKRISKYEGGLVLEPKAGLYEDFILVLDFNSLYPSIIQEYNLCYTTVKREKKVDHPEEQQEEEEEQEEMKEQLKEDGDGDVVINEDTQFVLPDLPATVEEKDLAPLPKMIRYLVQKRREVKGLMKNEKDPLKAKQYDIKQLALKILANSMYGCLGFTNSRFCATKIASTVTSTGRFILHNTLKLAEKAGYSVVYGDTDSIMIYTGVKDYQECMKIGESLKREINKQYKYLQIDIDYVFQRMLLLKKKKYAALKVVNYSNGKITSQREVKGIDLVRRDWSLITKMAGNRLLELLFSDSNEEENDFRVKIGEYLDDLAKRMRNNEIPLEQYAITKSLTHALKDYNMKNVSNNPHVVVALRMQKAGQILNAGDFIRYIICISTDSQHPLPSNSLADRAFSIAEIRSSHGILKPDIDWYLKNQLLPTLSRLVAPLGDSLRSRLYEWLGIAYTASSSDYQDDYMEIGSAFKPRLLREDYDILYEKAHPIMIACPVCKKSYSFKGFLPNTGEGVHTNCVCGVKYPEKYIHNTLINYGRHAIMKYYTSGYSCSDSLCGYHSNRLNMCDDHCNNITCQGHMKKTCTASECYLDLCYAIATITNRTNPNTKQNIETIKCLESLLNQLDYTYIKLSMFK